MAKITQKDINDAVWKACDTFRGSIDPSVYKDYVLTMLFLKYLSDVHDDKMEGYLAKYSGDVERARRAMQHERFVVPPHSHFKFLYDSRNEANIGELINIALADLEEANREKLYSEDGAGIFQNIDFNNSKLGEPKDKNTRLKNLLLDFNKEALNLRPSHLDGNDIIGGAYMFLIENFASDAGKKAGEFFTPKEVSTLLAKLTKSKPGSRISDPTCGSASLLIKAGEEVGSDNFSLYGQEANGSTWALAVMNMFLHGFDNATIRWGDTIRNPKLKEGDTLMKFDTVVANPPFSLDKWGKVEDKEGDKTTVSYDPETDKYNRFWRGVPPKSKGDWAFISHMIETLNEHGKAGVVVPHGVLFRGSSEGRIRQRTIEENLLEAVIGLPANLFFGTGIPAAILIFNKQKTSNNVLFIDASKHYESAKNQNKLRASDIEHIVNTYRDFAAGKLQPGVVEDKFSYVATPEEIQENDYNLNIPRYVNTFEEEAEVDIAVVQSEIDSLEKELKNVQLEIDTYLKDLINKAMNFETPLSGGLLIIGSLLWDDHEIRVSLRNDTLLMDKATSVPAPIRYGRKSEIRNTYTMVISSDCKSDEKIGIGSLIPFRNNIDNSTELDHVATSIINAERKEIKPLNRYNWDWGCLVLLINPIKSDNQNVKQLIKFWSSKFSNGFNPSDYVVTNEQSLISKQGILFIDWKDEYGDLDFIVLTATKPTNPVPTTLIISESFKMDNTYFMGNRNNNIQTYQDDQIINFLNTAHEEKS